MRILFSFVVSAISVTFMTLPANAIINGSGFSPKSSLTCVDRRTGQYSRVTISTIVSRGGGHVFNRQLAVLNGFSYESASMTIPSIRSAFNRCGMENPDKVCFEYFPATDWRKLGYDYDTGEFTAEIHFSRPNMVDPNTIVLDHCR